MNKIPILFFLLLLSFGRAQEKIPYIDYQEIAQTASLAAQEGDYDKTIAILNRVSQNDSTYYSVLVSKVFYLLAQKNYESAIELVDEGIKGGNEEVMSSLYINKSVALMNLNRYEDALKVLNEALERYPVNNVLWYNKGVALENLGQTEGAVKSYQTAITLNPYYKKPFLQLGNICYKQERISQALMCFNMYLLLEPDADNAFTVLNSLNNIVNSDNVNSRNPDIRISSDDEAFDEIDLVIGNRVAVNKDYETGNDINIALTKQNHALMAQLEGFAGNGGFWDTKFVPFYKWIYDNGHFDNFTYTLSYAIENEKFKKIIEKNVDEISGFINLFRPMWSGLVQKNTREWYGKSQEVTYYFDENYLQGIGKLENDITSGPWEFYNENGRLTGKGQFDTEGNRHGNWTWYFEKGIISETASYSKGKINGRNIKYYRNGRTEIDANYKDNNFDGEYLYYNKKGALKQRQFYKAGNLDGIYSSYFNVGEAIKEFHIPYLNGKVDDTAIEYYATGQIYSEIGFKEGERNGPELQYHPNGKLSAEISNLNGKINGSYNTYYSNGNIREKGQALNGLYEGPWKTYYDDGTLEGEFIYKDGLLNGTSKNYDTDGKLHFEYEYRKGEVIAYKFYDKAGDIIREDKKKGGEFYYYGYSPQGNLTTEGLYDIKGGKKGIWKFYDTNGLLLNEGNYTDNKIDGEYKSYSKNGEVNAVTPYKNDTISGYYVDYHLNGKIKNQGWYKDNNYHGEWRAYYVDGTLQKINFYHKGLYHGKQKYFGPDGTASGESSYLYGDLLKDIYFDQQGNLFSETNYEQQENNYELVTSHINGKPESKMQYLNGILHGSYNLFDFYGRKEISGSYVNGEQHGKWEWYHENGQVETSATYVSGKLNGEFLSYYEDGQVEDQYFYDYGVASETWKSYHPNGNLNTSTAYKNDNPHGRKEFYSKSGKLQLIRYYDHGRLIGYSYLDKNGMEIPMIPLKNETGILVAYYDNGRVSREMEYKNGEIVNNYKQYYYLGQLESETPYLHGEYHGKHIEYLSDGKVKKERNFVLGNLHGLEKEFHENGNLKRETNYLNNIKNGYSRTYDDQGKLELEEKYFNGNVFSSKMY